MILCSSLECEDKNCILFCFYIYIAYFLLGSESALRTTISLTHTRQRFTYEFIQCSSGTECAADSVVRMQVEPHTVPYRRKLSLSKPLGMLPVL